MLHIIAITQIISIFVTSFFEKLFMTIGEILKQFRERMGLTQAVVADFLGIKREVLSYYENDTREAPIEILEKLAHLYGIELTDFFEENENLMQANIAFAFRAENLSEGDLTQIASFRKIIKNHFKLLELKEAHVTK